MFCILGAVKHLKWTTMKPLTTENHRKSSARSTIAVTSTVPGQVTNTSPTTAHNSSTTISPSPTQPSTSSPPSSPQPRSGHKKPPHHRKHTLVTAEAARSVMLWSTAGVRGAVVALTLGIAVTVLTLVYVGCHYRHQRRITRRHRHPQAGSDADYLVNGMYL